MLDAFQTVLLADIDRDGEEYYQEHAEQWLFDYAGVGQYQKAFGNPHLNHGMYGHTWLSMV